MGNRAKTIAFSKADVHSEAMKLPSRDDSDRFREKTGNWVGVKLEFAPPTRSKRVMITVQLLDRVLQWIFDVKQETAGTEYVLHAYLNTVYRGSSLKGSLRLAVHFWQLTSLLDTKQLVFVSLPATKTHFTASDDVLQMS